jgi:hypothetical protein
MEIQRINMNGDQKKVRPACYRVLDWCVRHSDSNAWERNAARTVRAHGIHSEYQENVLSDACESCGMQDLCEYSEDCRIGETGRTSADVPSQRPTGDRSAREERTSGVASYGSHQF